MNISTEPVRISKIRFMRFFVPIRIIGHTHAPEIKQSLLLDLNKQGGAPVFKWKYNYIAFNQVEDDIIYMLVNDFDIKVINKDKQNV